MRRRPLQQIDCSKSAALPRHRCRRSTGQAMNMNKKRAVSPKILRGAEDGLIVFERGSNL